MATSKSLVDQSLRFLKSPFFPLSFFSFPSPHIHHSLTYILQPMCHLVIIDLEDPRGSDEAVARILKVTGGVRKLRRMPDMSCGLSSKE